MSSEKDGKDDLSGKENSTEEENQRQTDSDEKKLTKPDTALYIRLTESKEDQDDGKGEKFQGSR